MRPQLCASLIHQGSRRAERTPLCFGGFISSLIAMMRKFGVAPRKMLLQLDAMFGTGGDPHPASDACDGYIVKNWKTHPRIGGAYSHPSLNAHGSRTAMQEAIHGAVFLAGEACHEGVNPCIHGAMETGEKAAERAAAVIASQGGAWSKL